MEAIAQVAEVLTTASAVMSRLASSSSGCSRATFGLEHPRGRTRKLLKLGRWPRRAREQFTAAVWACPGEAPIWAIAAKRALERTDAGIGWIRWQISVAALTPGTHL